MSFRPLRLSDLPSLLAVAAPIIGAAALPGTAQAQASFACRLEADQCHFAILHKDGRRTDFVLRHGEARVMDDAAAGTDRYMVAADFVPPAEPSSCSRAPVVGSKPPRSRWCRLSTVRPDQND